MDGHRELDAKALLRRRRAIDALDAELLRLLNQRARLASEVGRIKRSCGLPIYDGRRERQGWSACAERIKVRWRPKAF
jgi:chorismate mutase